MAKYKPKKNDMIMVRWRDAATTARWVEQSEHEDATTIAVLTVGIFVERKRGDIKIALSLSEVGHYGDILAIPFSQVTEIYKLVGDETIEPVKVETNG